MCLFRLNYSHFLLDRLLPSILQLSAQRFVWKIGRGKGLLARSPNPSRLSFHPSAKARRDDVLGQQQHRSREVGTDCMMNEIKRNEMNAGSQWRGEENG
mmetsp:Transcript_31670/g.62680  ORF Transcript_31670/g.62680 Transcript_31670/m.62680 type:complete len:99 (-) Transcript_31670:940-1236(-)